jgi:hypothetical protein
MFHSQRCDISLLKGLTVLITRLAASAILFLAQKKNELEYVWFFKNWSDWRHQCTSARM